MATLVRRPLASRPLDLVYFCFLLMHIPASLLVDFQALYPQFLVPAALQKLIPFYVEMSGDPLITGAFNYHGQSHSYTWFRSFLWLELLFQFPTFVLGARGLWKDSPSIYLPLLIYGASTTTTLLPCLTVVLTTPTVAEPAAGFVTPAQRLILLSSYMPFLLVPLAMTLDMALRLSHLLDLRRHASADLAARVKREE